MTQQPHTLPIEDRLRRTQTQYRTIHSSLGFSYQDEGTTREALVNPDGPEAADIIAALYGALEAAHVEAVKANDVIRINRDGVGQGRVKAATAVHRIAAITDEALSLARGGRAVTDRLFAGCCVGTDAQHATWEMCPHDAVQELTENEKAEILKGGRLSGESVPGTTIELARRGFFNVSDPVYLGHIGNFTLSRLGKAVRALLLEQVS